MILTIIGIGLIGGSMAMELRQKKFCNKIIGVDLNKEHQKKAIHYGLVDEICELQKGVEKADFIIISTPVNVSPDILQNVLDRINNQIVIDVGSTKEKIIEKIHLHPKRKQFVATHPIAGTEFSGPDAAQVGLFKNKINIICNKEESSKYAIDKTIELYNHLEMQNIFMNAQDHDIHSAYVSHISHISSFCLALSVMDKEKDEKNILNMAGSGFESTVRLAKSNKEMWTPIFTENKNNILAVLNDYIEKLQDFKDAIAKNDKEELNSLIHKANGIKKILDK
tara:strand:- start:1698 stop:2540 length:843 start_codon:yes stop_codon:yes gene_type:complete